MWPDEGCAGGDTGMLIDGLSGTVPRRETTELVEEACRRRLGRGCGPLDSIPHHQRGGLVARECRFPLAGAAPTTIHKGMSAYDVVVHCTVVTERFPVPFASSPSRAQPAHTPTCANALHGRSWVWVIFFLEENSKPARVYPISDKISFFHNDSVNFASPARYYPRTDTKVAKF